MMTIKEKTFGTPSLPELLSPAGSPEALDAAIAGGADAVYFGASLFNARMNAKNFTGDTLAAAIDKCRLHGVKTNITLNTLIHNREIPDFLKCVEELYNFGADALIVADLGAASLIKKYFPDMELHASTQAAGHNSGAAKELSKLGFSRMVAARELSLSDLTYLCKNSPIETEIFIHGAICVSQSGGCLASSLIGGRSGNRGECAQPCRLPYKACKKGRESYALSLKDICLAAHITDILDLGAASLKIEGRMKSPDYVYGVTKIYRRLLDEGRNATEKEISELKALFSRSGFTDGYFTKRIGKDMLGVRTDADKADTSNLASENYSALLRDMGQPINMRVSIKNDKPAELHASVGEYSAAAYGVVPDEAVNRPLNEEAVMKNITKLGGTPFTVGECEIDLDDGLIMPISALNSLRREAVEELTKKLILRRNGTAPEKIDLPEKVELTAKFTARFGDYESIPDDVGKCEIVYIPLEKFTPEMTDKVSGVIIPPVVFDSERDEVVAMLKSASDAGIRHALVANVGHIAMAKEAGMTVHGDFRLNVYNNFTRAVLTGMGFADIIASPELTLPQLRDLGLPPVIYGRIPLMTLEKCVIRDIYSCDECEKRGYLPLTDRRGVEFPLTRAFKHRNIMYNSVPTFMADRPEELTKYRINGGHYIFTDEKKSFIEGLLTNKIRTPQGEIRRISK